MAITNVIVTRTPAGDIDQGDTVLLRVRWTGIAADHEVRITWGDGEHEVNTVLAAGPAYDETYGHTYNDGGSFDIRADIYAGAASNNGGLLIDVNNKPPTITSSSGILNNNTGVVNIAVIFTDPGTDEVFTITINWGDGSSDVSSLTAVGTFNASHTYTTRIGDTFRRQIIATVTDSSNESDISRFYPATSYPDDVDDTGIGIVTPYGIVLYDLSVDKSGVGGVIVDGTPFYTLAADDTISGVVVAAAAVDYTSVFVISTIDVECEQVGNIPFTELIPPA